MKNATPKLRKKSFTIVEQACHEIHGFSKLYQELQDKVTLSGQTQSTLKNYARKLAHLSLHPHVHCIVPGGGIDYKGNWKGVNISASGKSYLFPVENLSRVFRGKFMAALQKHIPQEKPFIRELYRTNWVVYAKEPFAGPDQVVEYLGRYTHKVAISNHRLQLVDKTRVQFSYRDYRDNRSKVMTLTGVEFLRRFCQHILPKGFVRIRHYGLLSASRKKQLKQLQKSLGVSVAEKRVKKDWKQICREHLGYDPDLCPECRQGRMITIQWLDAVRGPPEKPWNPQVANRK